ncbi:hypothetical protein F2Q70_00029078 [Brassica cretica]|uniref:Uncharacterized protein n=1 Tax=Brassica cretica TaxID=69181 RepID=A0A8S9GZP1_BRACR|nr:hypothetical protein F2Q70_00029078 [Brassica cretica]KAF2551223.1 hypothetical protein F2Q68_00033455 [Brassica cretica]
MRLELDGDDECSGSGRWPRGLILQTKMLVMVFCIVFAVEIAPPSSMSLSLLRQSSMSLMMFSYMPSL